MEVIYNVRCKFKNDINIKKDDIKKLFNQKLLNIIIKEEKKLNYS